MAVKRWVFAKTRFHRLQRFPRIGRQTQWCFTTRNSFRPVTVTACSSPSTDPGIGLRTNKAVTTWSFKRSPARAHRMGAKYLRMVSRGQSRPRGALHIDPAAWQWDRTEHSMCPTMYGDESTESSIREVQRLVPHRLLHARVRPRRLAQS